MQFIQNDVTRFLRVITFPSNTTDSFSDNQMSKANKGIVHVQTNGRKLKLHLLSPQLT